jgi:tRNA pseudouridine38-40 synthase
MPVVRLTIEYDGTDYRGWQRQPAAPTIQGAIESAIRQISGEHASVVGAGRTDAGVHAAGQVAHFQTQASLEPRAWCRALNAVLPPDVKVIAADTVSDSFHARFSAVRKCYRYRILNRPAPSPLERRTSWHVPHRLDLSRMRRAAASLIGTHDFLAFEAADPSHDTARDTHCRLTRCSIRRQGDLVVVEIESNRLLKYMVRNIVGTLVEVGLARRPAGDTAQILRSRDRRRAGVTAPAHGLTLIAVRYGKSARPGRGRS